MQEKTCSICKFPKSRDEFNKNSARRDGRQTHCKECGKGNSKRYYAENKARMVKQILLSKKLRIQSNYEHILRYLAEHPCMDCGEKDVLVLDFDHVRGKKKMNVTQLVVGGYSAEAIDKEIAKCEVRCANCHRRKTARQFNNSRNVWVCGDNGNMTGSYPVDEGSNPSRPTKVAIQG